MDDITKKTTRNSIEPSRRFDNGRRPVRPGADVYVRRPSPLQTPEKIAPGPATTNAPRQRTTSTVKPAVPRTKRSMVLRRQMVERAEIQRKRTKKVRKIHFAFYSLTSVILIALGSVVWAFRDSVPFIGDSFDEKPTYSNAIDSDPEELSTLDETPRTSAEITQSHAAANAPKIIRIPKLNTKAKITQVGTTLTNEPISPQNIFDVGWYESSGQPDTPGALLLNGHVAGPTQPGVFSRAAELATGDTILIERGDGQVITYTVSKVQEYASGQIDMSAATKPIDPSRIGLNLVTTQTKFSGAKKRVIVFALM